MIAAAWPSRHHATARQSRTHQSPSPHHAESGARLGCPQGPAQPLALGRAAPYASTRLPRSNAEPRGHAHPLRLASPPPRRNSPPAVLHHAHSRTSTTRQAHAPQPQLARTANPARALQGSHQPHAVKRTRTASRPHQAIKRPSFSCCAAGSAAAVALSACSLDTRHAFTKLLRRAFTSAPVASAS